MTMKVPHRYFFKFNRWNVGHRIAWFLIQRYINTKRYQVTLKYTGPRPRGAHSTPRANRTGWRVYIEPRKTALAAERFAIEYPRQPRRVFAVTPIEDRRI